MDNGRSDSIYQGCKTAEGMPTRLDDVVDKANSD